MKGKKFFSILLSILMICSTFGGISVSAISSTDDDYVWINGIGARVTDTVTYTYYINSNYDWENFQGQLEYDKSGLQLESFSMPDIGKDGTDGIMINTDIEGYVYYAGSNISGYKTKYKDVRLCKATFKVLQHGTFTIKNSPEIVTGLNGEAIVDDFKISDVMIFLGGNASKQYYVKELMHDDCIGFGKDQIIQFIGEGQVDENLSDEYQVNCKTAVAFGQLVLSNYTVNRASHKEPPFLFNVGYYDDDDKFVTVLEKNERSKDWKVANYVDGEGEALNLYFTTSPTKERNAMKPCYYSVEDFFEDDKRSVYLRVHDEDHVEFRLCEYGMAPSNDEPVNVDMIIKLDNY